jgi:hypothetical protein
VELQNLVSRFKLGQQTAGGATRVSTAYRPPRRVAADPVRARTVLALAAKPPMERTLQPAGHDLDGE